MVSHFDIIVTQIRPEDEKNAKFTTKNKKDKRYFTT